MHGDSLHGDLYNHLHWWLRECHPVAGPFNEGRAYRWVMDIWWFNECRKMAMASNRYVSFVNFAELRREAEFLLGLPIDIREQDDRPAWMWRVPHLETAP